MAGPSPLGPSRRASARSSTVYDGRTRRSEWSEKYGQSRSLLRQGNDVRFTFIRAEKATWPVRVMCRVLGVSPSGFYAWCKRPNSPRVHGDTGLAVAIAESHTKSRGTYGSPRVHADLRAQGYRVSRKRIIRLMRSKGLVGAKRKGWVRTTEADPAAVVAPNLLDRDFTASKPNERWSSRPGW